MTDEVDLVEADLEGLFVGVTGLTLARLIAMNAFDGIGSINHCVTGILIHSVSSFRGGSKYAVSESMFWPVDLPPASRETVLGGWRCTGGRVWGATGDAF